MLCLFYSLRSTGTYCEDKLKQPWEAVDTLRSSSQEINGNRSFMKFPITKFITFYQKFIGPVKGQKCPMTPSCSQYAYEAFEKHGLFLGILMTADRLHRCGHDVSQYEKIIVGSQIFYFDPVFAHVISYYKAKR